MYPIKICHAINLVLAWWPGHYHNVICKKCHRISFQPWQHLLLESTAVQRGVHGLFGMAPWTRALAALNGTLALALHHLNWGQTFAWQNPHAVWLGSFDPKWTHTGNIPVRLGPWCGNSQGVSGCCPQCGDVAVKTTAPRLFLDSSTSWMLKPPTASISDYSSWKNTLIFVRGPSVTELQTWQNIFSSFLLSHMLCLATEWLKLWIDWQSNVNSKITTCSCKNSVRITAGLPGKTKPSPLQLSAWHKNPADAQCSQLREEINSAPRMKHCKATASTRELRKRHLRAGVQHSSLKHT